MKEYSYSIEMPHSAERIWAAMNDYEKWPEFAKPMVTGISVSNRGNEIGEGLVRNVHYKLPFGLKGTSIETVHDITPGVQYTYTSDGGTVGTIRLEQLGPTSTRLHFHEKILMKWPFSMFEGRIQKFIADYNRKTMLNMSEWLAKHPEYAKETAEPTLVA